MSLGELGALGEFVGAVGVMITLIYVAVQIRQTRKIVMAQAFQQRSDALQDLSMRMAESESLSAISAKLRSSGWPRDGRAFEELSDREKEQYRAYLTAHLHRVTNLIHQYDEGLLTTEYYEGGIRGTIVMWVTMWKAAQIRIRLSGAIDRVYRDALLHEPSQSELDTTGAREAGEDR